MHKTLSIVVPCYRCRSTLRRLLDSIKMQDLPKSEYMVILMNDNADVERYEDIALEYRRYIDVREMLYACDYYTDELIKEKNRGAGMARQYGMEWSDADWIMWIDADDELMGSTALTSLTKHISDDYDIICGEIYSEKHNTVTFHENIHVTANLYRKSFLIDNEIQFCPDRKASSANEDVGFNLICGFYTKRICYSETPIYLWHDNNESITHDKEWARKNIVGGLANRAWAIASTYSNEKHYEVRDNAAIVLIAFYLIIPDFTYKDGLDLDYVLDCIKTYYECVKPIVGEITAETLFNMFIENPKEINYPKYPPVIGFGDYCRYILGD